MNITWLNYVLSAQIGGLQVLECRKVMFYLLNQNYVLSGWWVGNRINSNFCTLERVVHCKVNDLTNTLRLGSKVFVYWKWTLEPKEYLKVLEWTIKYTWTVIHVGRLFSQSIDILVGSLCYIHTPLPRGSPLAKRNSRSPQEELTVTSSGLCLTAHWVEWGALILCILSLIPLCSPALSLLP